MDLLLDTHVLLWSLLEPQRLAAETAMALDDKENRRWLSPITSWEVMVLADTGRIDLQSPPEDWLAQVLLQVPFTEAPLTLDVAILSRRVSLPHRDPADRFLAATAMVHELVLVTADAHLLGLSGLNTMTA